MRYKKNIYLTSLLLITLGVSPVLPGSFLNNAYEPVAQVRLGTDLCTNELSALAIRQQNSILALENFIGCQVTALPNISLVGSGGGMRSSIAFLGLLRGLEKIGLLDAVSYMSMLSGSTWPVASWLTSGYTLDQLTNYLRYTISTSTSITNFPINIATRNIIAKLESLREASFCDIYGAFLANIFLTPALTNSQTPYLSQLESVVATGNYPIPLFVNALGETSPFYQNLESSPFEIGSTYLNTWVTPAAFGKKFNNGLSYDTRPEENLGYMLAMFGSAYAGNFTDLTNLVIQDLQDNYGIVLPNELALHLPTGNGIRISPCSVNNFTSNIAISPLKNSWSLTPVDAGVNDNLAFSPLFRRNITLYIVCDASADDLSSVGNELIKISQTAKINNIPFPTINFDMLSKEPISIWYDQNDASVPIIIYVPNFQEFSTFKFDYTPDELDTLLNGIENVVTQNINLFKQAINIIL